MNEQHLCNATRSETAWSPVTRQRSPFATLLGLCVLSFVVVAASACGATRKPLSRSQPWEVATHSVQRPPSADGRKQQKPGAALETEQVRVDPRLKEKVTLRSEGTDLRSLLLGLSKQTQINIVLGDEVRGTVSAYLNDVPVLDALYQILRPMGFDLAIEDGFVRVYRPGLETQIYRLHYLRDLRLGTNMTTVSAMSVGGMSGGTQSSGGMGGMGGGSSMMGGMGGGSSMMGGMGGSSGMGGAGMDTSSTMLTSMFMVNFWDELGDELESMIFQGRKPSQEQQTQNRRRSSAGGGQMIELLEHGRSVGDETGRALTMNSMSGTIVVTAPRETLRSISNYIDSVRETIQRQVVIEMRILEVSLSDGFEMGVDARGIPLLPSEVLPDIIGEENAPMLNARFGFGDFLGVEEVPGGARRPPIFGFGSGDPDSDWSAAVTALSTLGDVNVVSAPRISALHNQKAIVKVVRDRVFYIAHVSPTIVSQTTTAIQPIQFVPVVVPEGVVVDVTPLIDDDGYVTLEVHPSFSVIFGERMAPNGQGSQPEVERREFHSTVRVKNEQTVVLGGLISERTIRTEEGIPLLKNIPFLGALFRHTEERKEKAELIVLLTPRIQNAALAREYVNSLRTFSGKKTLEEEAAEREEQRKKEEEKEEAKRKKEETKKRKEEAKARKTSKKAESAPAEQVAEADAATESEPESEGKAKKSSAETDPDALADALSGAAGDAGLEENADSAEEADAEDASEDRGPEASAAAGE